MLRSICSEESSSRSASREHAVEQAEHEAEAAADGEPDQRALRADPDMVQQRAAEQRSQNATAVALGAGSTRAESQPEPRRELPDQKQRHGTSQGASGRARP